MFDIRTYEPMAMLELPESEREQLGKRAQALMESFRAVESVDAAGVEPLVTVLGLRNVMRDDVAEKRFTREEIMKNAPAQQDGFFQVPGTLA